MLPYKKQMATSSPCFGSAILSHFRRIMRCKRQNWALLIRYVMCLLLTVLLPGSWITVVLLTHKPAIYTHGNKALRNTQETWQPSLTIKSCIFPSSGNEPDVHSTLFWIVFSVSQKILQSSNTQYWARSVTNSVN